VVLGRNPDCDIVLDLGAVSRHHARILNIEGLFYVEDQGSRNGTFLNGNLVTGQPLLQESDQLRVCDLVFVFHQGPGMPDTDDALETIESETRSPSGVMMVDEDPRLTSGSTVMSKFDVSVGSTGLRLAMRPEAKLKALVEIGQHLGKTISADAVLPKLLDSLFAIFPQADRGLIVLKDVATGNLIPAALKHRRNDQTETIRISRTIINEVIAAGEAILSADAASDSRFEMAESIVDFHIRSMMCAPLIGVDGDSLGVIQIDTLDQRQRFAREDLDVLASVANQVAYAVENAQLHEVALREKALEQELLVAHEVQQGFLPASRPDVEEYGFFDFYEPANQLGGDYFDYVRLPGGRLAIVLADVSGKGISAALLVAKLSAEIRYLLVSEDTPAEVVAKLNAVFCGSRWEDRFVTMVLAVLDPARHEVTLVNAGHMPPLLSKTDGSVVEVGGAEGGLPLGVDPGLPYEHAVIELAAGESLTIFTDGITEAMNCQDELYGGARLWTQVGARHEKDDVKALGIRILDDVRQFVGSRSQSDDMCLTCFGRLSEV
ncbi:MAG: SpoIIE family protein phosphatase, partial [Planctomycetota bacterium]|nr:SpoIIE family protein phosphatase [Planctomycetota bacterium]